MTKNPKLLTTNYVQTCNNYPMRFRQTKARKITILTSKENAFYKEKSIVHIHEENLTSS